MPKMESRAVWRKYKSFSGPLVNRGDAVLQEPDMDDYHFDRAFWLTSMVETGGIAGLVNMYDGCGATCGLHQAIAVYPRDLSKQGPLWKLLWRMDSVVPIDYYYLGDQLDSMSWRITAAGLVHRDTGELIKPKVIRNTLTPKNGRVPETGPEWDQSKQWAEAFAELFMITAGIRAQVLTGIEHMHKMAKRHVLKLEIDKYTCTIENRCYNDCVDNPNPYIDPAADLAMCLFWCNAINGPTPAKRALEKASLCKDPTDPAQSHKFAEHLIRLLGNSKYGRWDDDLKPSRYQKAREYALKIWPKELFVGPKAVMPKDLPG